MELNLWSNRHSTASSRRYHHQSRSGYDETDGDDDLNAMFLCPFCAEDFDIVGLCCHIDEDHPIEAKNGVCPVCAKRVGTDIVSHITMQHGNFFKISFSCLLRRGGPNSTFSLLRKELRDGNLQSLLGGSSCFVSSSNTEADPLLSSFIFNSPKVDEPLSVQPLSITEPTLVKESSNENLHERHVQQPPLSDKDQEEKARKSEFVQGLVLSTILGDYL
ncbi:protein DEHYDRATION-INDUCED 19 [Citrus sinensis]|nr:protein DEHYDRATION-INDUCED 19 [Citrus sinensis]